MVLSVVAKSRLTQHFPPPCNCKLTPSLLRGDCHFLITLDSRSSKSLQMALTSKTNHSKMRVPLSNTENEFQVFSGGKKKKLRKEISVTSSVHLTNRYLNCCTVHFEDSPNITHQQMH